MKNTKRIRGNQVDASQARQYWLDSPVWEQKRPCNSPFDFGGSDTVGYHMKRCRLDFHEYEDNLDFGMYMGEQKDGKWVVGIFNEDSSVRRRSTL